MQLNVVVVAGEEEEEEEEESEDVGENDRIGSQRRQKILIFCCQLVFDDTFSGQTEQKPNKQM